MRIEGLVKDEGGILFLHINNKNIQILDNGHFSHRITMNDDSQKIVVEAADNFGNLARKELKINQLLEDRNVAKKFNNTDLQADNATKPVFWGLGVGVSSYNSTIPDLKYAHDDVMALEKFFSEIKFKTLIDEDVSRESIIKNISNHLGKAAPDDVVFIFMAGRGIKHRQTGSYYFLPHNVDNENLLSRGVRMSDFEEALSILSQNVSKVILAMDTCHSGALKIGSRTTFVGEDLISSLREASGFYILSAAKSGEESFEDEQYKIDSDDRGHGVFTYALLKGMSGAANYDNDDYISLHEIFKYVSKQVPRLTSGHQHPYYCAKGTDMPLIVIEN